MNVYVKESLERLAEDKEGKRDMERYRDLSSPGYIEAQSLRIVQEAIEKNRKKLEGKLAS